MLIYWAALPGSFDRSRAHRRSEGPVDFRRSRVLAAAGSDVGVAGQVFGLVLGGWGAVGPEDSSCHGRGLGGTGVRCVPCRPPRPPAPLEPEGAPWLGAAPALAVLAALRTASATSLLSLVAVSVGTAPEKWLSFNDDFLGVGTVSPSWGIFPVLKALD